MGEGRARKRTGIKMERLRQLRRMRMRMLTLGSRSLRKMTTL